MQQAPKTESPAAFSAFQFREITHEEQAEFEDICDFQTERAAILEYEAGYSREDADREAERLTLERFPPSETARALILERAAAMAAHYGFPEWNAEKCLDDARIHRLHISADYWLALCDYFDSRREVAKE